MDLTARRMKQSPIDRAANLRALSIAMSARQRPTVGWVLAGLLGIGIIASLGKSPAGDIIATGLALYFLPWFVAWWRQSPNSLAIFVLNLFAGWTVIAWIVALVWACTAIRKD